MFKKKINQKKKIIFFVSEDWYFYSHRFDLAKFLVKKNFIVLVVSKFSKYNNICLENGIKTANINIDRGKLTFFKDVLILFQLYKIIKNFNPDIIHNVAIKPIFLGSIIGKICNVPIIINAFAGMGYLFTDPKNLVDIILSKFSTFLFYLIFKISNPYFIIQNKFDKIFINKLFNISNSKIYLIHGSGLDTKKYNIKKNIHINKKNINIIMHSRILWDKGVKEFKEAATILSKKNNKYKFLLVGKNDKNNPSCVPDSVLNEWNKLKYFKWLGYKENILSYILKSDISCLPSYREGLPRSILEDCSCGIPVIASDIPGCREIIQNNFNGLLIPVKDSILLAKAIEKLALNTSLGKKFAKRGRKIIISKFSFEKISKKTLNLYLNLLENKSKL